jgi:hypothetical protein
MVVAYVGFLGGWSKAVLGPDSLFLGAAMVAVLVRIVMGEIMKVVQKDCAADLEIRI